MHSFPVNDIFTVMFLPLQLLLQIDTDHLGSIYRVHLLRMFSMKVRRWKAASGLTWTSTWTRQYHSSLAVDSPFLLSLLPTIPSLGFGCFITFINTRLYGKRPDFYLCMLIFIIFLKNNRSRTLITN